MTSRADRTDTKRDVAPRDGFKMTEIGELPSSWSSVKLGDVITFSRKPRQLPGHETIPFIPMSDIPENGNPITRWELRTADEVRSGVYVQDGDILLAKITPCLENGKQGIVTGLPNGWGYATTEVFPFHVVDASLEFVAYCIRQSAVRERLIASMQGTTGRRRLPKDTLKRVVIALPPLPEQRAIARVLRTVQEAIEATERVIEAAKELKRSMMEYLFTYGPVPVDQAEDVELRQIEGSRSPSHWATSTLGEIARVGNGSTPKRSNESYWQDGTFPWLTSGKVHELLIREADEFVTEAALSECHLPRVKPGNLVVAITGQGKTLGLSALVDVEATINQHLAYVALRNEDVLPEFLLMFLRQNYTRLREIGQSGGSTKAALTCGFLRSLVVPVPPLEEQQKIVSILGSSQLAVDAGEHRKQELDSLFNSLLHHLMTGKLRVTPTEADREGTDSMRAAGARG